MGKKVRILLAPGDRLEALIANGNTPQKHVRRARIVLLAGDGIGTVQKRRKRRKRRDTIPISGRPLETKVSPSSH